MISRLLAGAAVLLALLGALYIWGLARSPDSGWEVGLVAALPFLGLAVALGLAARWTRHPRD